MYPIHKFSFDIYVLAYMTVKYTCWGFVLYWPYQPTNALLLSICSPRSLYPPYWLFSKG